MVRLADNSSEIAVRSMGASSAPCNRHSAPQIAHCGCFHRLGAFGKLIRESGEIGILLVILACSDIIIYCYHHNHDHNYEIDYYNYNYYIEHVIHNTAIPRLFRLDKSNDRGILLHLQSV